MGSAVDETVDWPSGYIPGVVEHHDQWTWSHPYVRYAELLHAAPGLRRVVVEHLRHWQRAFDAVADGRSALVISSGGSIEPVLVAVFTGGDYRTWGSALHHLEGATLTFSGTRCVGLTMRHSVPSEP